MDLNPLSYLKRQTDYSEREKFWANVEVITMMAFSLIAAGTAFYFVNRSERAQANQLASMLNQDTVFVQEDKGLSSLVDDPIVLPDTGLEFHACCPDVTAVYSSLD